MPNEEIYLNALLKYKGSNSETEVFIKIGELKEIELDMLYVDEFFASNKDFQDAVKNGTDEFVIVEYWQQGQRKHEVKPYPSEQLHP